MNAVTVPTAQAALTKFRVPRLRGDIVPRADLLARLAASVEGSPVTLVCAPGGSGKTVLLSQFAAAAVGPAQVLWIALDEDDDDANRLFAALVHAVEPLRLAWEIDPRVLLAGLTNARSQMRAALAALVNALCTSVEQRLIVVMDDLHRLQNPEAFSLLESLVERLPEHVALVLGTRVEPPLPLARWRAHGEVSDLGPTDLRFDAATVRQLVENRHGSGAIAAVDEVLSRTGGWAVGVSMLLQGQSPVVAAPSARDGAGAAGRARLFDYLAQEILRDLPGTLRDFMLRSSVLTELNVAQCDAVNGMTGSSDLLREIYRRNLFVTPIDEIAPVLRFHDLFREFLQVELQRRLPAEVAVLHVRAAQSEAVAARAVHHYLQARDWPKAIELISSAGEGLIVEGGVATVERWFEQIPPEARAASPHVAYMSGLCGWLRWDWQRARRELPAAIVGLGSSKELPRRVSALFQLIDSLNSSGDIEGARRRLDEVAQLPLDDLGRATLELQRAWVLVPEGDRAAIETHMREFIRHVARDPQRICPAIAGRMHCLLIGLPGIADCFERYVELAEPVREPLGRPWHLALCAFDGWTRLWRGDRPGVERALERGMTLFPQFRGLRLMAERMSQFRAVALGAMGEVVAAEELAQQLLRALDAPEVAFHRNVWKRAYQTANARFWWAVQDVDRWREAARPLMEPRSAVEWSFVEATIPMVHGQEAIVGGRWREAIAQLEQAEALFARTGMPAICNDPRIGLAYARLRAGDAAAARRSFEPVYRDAVTSGRPGTLLVDARSHVRALLATLPDATRRSDEFARLQATLDTWWTTSSADGAGAASAAAPRAQAGRPRLGGLSDRELEVLARVAAGASNKHIARELDLSLHTVKRHLCNILDKLDCDSRGQAADLFRRAAA